MSLKCLFLFQKERKGGDKSRTQGQLGGATPAMLGVIWGPRYIRVVTHYDPLNDTGIHESLLVYRKNGALAGVAQQTE